MKGRARNIKDRGNVGDIMAVGIFVLAMTIIMFSFLDVMSLIRQKAEVSQLARKYILRMESTGGLQDSDRVTLLLELQGQGVTEAALDGTTCGAAGYGEPISLEIRGKLGGKYEFEEKRVSTAKY